MDLQDKAAIITGASAGIGRAVARALARHGCRVTLTARRGDQIDQLAGAIIDLGGQALAVPADIRDEAALTRVFEASQKRWGRLDILINNAGIGRKAPLHGGATEGWRAMWEVNVLGLSIATREALARFNPQSGGHVVNISSMAGHRVPPGGGFYAATKHAVRALTEVLRGELRANGSRSRVSAISPGFVDTEFFLGYHEGDQAKARESVSHYKVLDPDDVAASVIHVITAPDHVAIHDMLMRPSEQPS